MGLNEFPLALSSAPEWGVWSMWSYKSARVCVCRCGLCAYLCVRLLISQCCAESSPAPQPMAASCLSAHRQLVDPPPASHRLDGL